MLTLQNGNTGFAICLSPLLGGGLWFLSEYLQTAFYGFLFCEMPTNLIFAICLQVLKNLGRLQ